MSNTAEERANLLREAASNGRRNPDDLFEARMMIHGAFEATGANSNRVCDLLISGRPPLKEWDCIRLEMIADLIEADPEARAEHLFGLCEMVKMIAPWQGE
nr:MAG TPA: hypothetical protein [Caudoviricetes sp.]